MRNIESQNAALGFDQPAASPDLELIGRFAMGTKPAIRFLKGEGPHLNGFG